MKISLEPAIAEILPTFLAESRDAVAVMEAAILQLEHLHLSTGASTSDRDNSRSDSEAEAIDEIFRGVHTLKGDAASLGFEKLSHFSHLLESALDVLRAGRPVDAAVIQFLLQGVDELRAAIVDAESHEDRMTDRQSSLESTIAIWMSGASSTASRPPRRKPSNKAVQAHRPERSTSSNRYLRVDVEKLDQLLTIVGEIAVSRASLTEELESGETTEAALGTHRAADRLHLELQDLVMRVRMVPVGPAFRRHQRLIRDLGARLGKKIRFQIIGGDVELDSSVLQLLQDPLSHMLRNAVAHGLETPERRLEAGKPETGTISLRTTQEAGSILIELEDDGIGIDRQRLRERAVEMGLLENGAEPPEQELLQLILEPGLSTSQEISEVSGRGVGMDVVRRNLETMGSTIQIESEPGRSTTIQIRLPLTLAVVDGLVVEVGDHLYVLPVDSVTELADLDGALCREQHGLLYLREQPLAAARLSDLVSASRPPHSRREKRPGHETVAVLRQGSAVTGLIVETIVGKSQIVIKPLPRVLEGISLLAGTSVLGSGKIAFVLDIRSVMQAVSRPNSPSSTPNSPERSLSHVR